MKSHSRFLELDVWRGLAIIGMIVFHFAFLLNYLSLVVINTGVGGLHLLARLVQWSFLLLVGIGLQLSYQKTIARNKAKGDFLKKNLIRGLMVLVCALVITLATALVIPEQYVRFGILHVIGVSMLLLGLIADRPKLALFISILIVFLTPIIFNQPTNIEVLVIFGFIPKGFQTIDYFPLFPWMAVPALGIFLGSFFYRNFQRRFKPLPISLPGSSSFASLGKKSLLIYMVHVPILIMVIFALNWLIGKLS
ncbi:MAG: heparan-alpha-glucosaminide N-acetyltransferase [bacterium]|nr:heparan-alpha-glucosaminide N-acetyltransferase [bacterium]